MNISDEAVEAARVAGLNEQYGAGMVTDRDIRAALEAAAPHLLVVDDRGMNELDEAVEAAVVAQYEAERGRDEWVPLDEMPEDFINRYRDQATLILAAAAPHLTADKRDTRAGNERE